MIELNLAIAVGFRVESRKEVGISAVGRNGVLITHVRGYH